MAKFKLRMEPVVIQVKNIIEYINNWKIEFYLKPRRNKIYTFKQNDNDNENIRWVFKNEKRIEFIIKNLTTELKDTIKKQVEKEHCSCKFTQRKIEEDYLMIVTEKSLCVIS